MMQRLAVFTGPSLTSRSAESPGTRQRIFSCSWLIFSNLLEEVLKLTSCSGLADMELLGSTLTATYARPKTSHFLPAISSNMTSNMTSKMAVNMAAKMATSYRSLQPPVASNLWRSSNFLRSSGGGVAFAPGFSSSSSSSTDPDLLRAKTMFYPSTRTGLATRYLPDDWHKSNQNQYRDSESSRKSAERLRRDTVRLMQDKEQQTRRTQEDTSKNLGQRLNDIVFWRSELSHELDNVVAETAALGDVRKRLERALAETEGPLQVRPGSALSPGSEVWSPRSGLKIR